MLELEKVNQVALDAARPILQPVEPRRVISEEIVDSTGNLALRVTVVLPDAFEEVLPHEASPGLVLAVHDALELAGEERFPLVGYATEQDLVDRYDPTDGDS